MLLLSFSLPKTATTLLYDASIMASSENDSISVSSIKEPSFFIENSDFISSSRILKKIVVSGNHFRGKNWFLKLYNQNSTIYFDYSTQYWLNPEKVITRARSLFPNQKIVAFAIQREPQQQLNSYISHLRRGYVDLGSLAESYKRDPDFASYLRKMYNWHYYDKKTFFENLNTEYHEFSFERVIDNPFEVLSELTDLDLPCFDISDLPKANPKSVPMIPYLNNLLFSNRLASFFKRRLPSALYTFLVVFRKSIIKLNLSTSMSSKNSNNDANFIQHIFL